MSESTSLSSPSRPGAPLDRVHPLIRTRQVRDFTDRRLEPALLDALAEVVRWTGSSNNRQPWRFLVLRDRATLRQIADAGQPQTRALQTAAAALAIALPAESERTVSNAYDEGRAAERVLIAAGLLGIGAGIAWVRDDVQAPIGALLGVPDGWFIRTVIALGYPTEAALRPKSAPGQARLPRERTVFQDRWPAE
ncbi:MAG: nitroreductase family protein [Candidatus Limnocylindrales bacterium]